MSKTALDKGADPTVPAGMKWSAHRVNASEGGVIFTSHDKPIDDAQLHRETVAAIGEGISEREWGQALANPAAWVTKPQSQWTAAALADGFTMYDAAAGTVAQQSPQRDFGQFFARVQNALASKDQRAIERLKRESPNRMAEMSARSQSLLTFSGPMTGPNIDAKPPSEFNVPDPKWLPVASVPSTLSDPTINKNGQRVRQLTVDNRVIEICEPKPGSQSEQYARDVARIIPLLPPLSREALTRVLVSPHPSDAGVVASVDSTTRVMNIYPNSDGTLPTPQRLFANVLHETGHLVHFSIGNENQAAWGFRDNLPFDTLWEHAVKKDRNHSSEYGMYAPLEDFAESYTEYWLARLNPTPTAKAEQALFKKEKAAREEILDQLARTSIAKLKQSVAPYKR